MSNSETAWVAVIDDDPSVRRSVTRFIRAQGIPADSYGTADEYLQRMRTEQPSCIVLDVQLLTGMSSFALLDRMDADGTRVPIIFMSGLVDLPVAKCDRYPELRTCLRKPFEVGTLIARVRFVLQGSGSAAS
jgi:FixJ family two-component response regulator